MAKKAVEYAHNIALLGIPFDDYSSYLKGSALAPAAIREAFFCKSTNTWSEEGINIGEKAIFHDVGDLQINSSRDVFEQIETAITDLLIKNIPVISLGGDHSITFPIIRAFSQKYSQLQILQFDAHPDLYEVFEGNKLSHACPFARIMENGLVERLVQVGIRSANDHLRQQAKKFNVEMVEMKDWDGDRNFDFETPLYISFDMDALDPAFAPGISHFEPGGLSTRQAISVIQELQAPQIVGADIVELNPKRDQSSVTAMVAAKILKEIASKMLSCQTIIKT